MGVVPAPAAVPVPVRVPASWKSSAAAAVNFAKN